MLTRSASRATGECSCSSSVESGTRRKIDTSGSPTKTMRTAAAITVIAAAVPRWSRRITTAPRTAVRAGLTGVAGGPSLRERWRAFTERRRPLPPAWGGSPSS